MVVMLADDWGFSDVGAFGGEIQTPNLNQLAQSGMRFSNFHVSASCSPTRSMLLTGVDNHLNGVGNMRETIPQSHVGRAGYLSVLNQRVVTVSSLLQDSGYRTYVAGKWHVGKEPHNLPPARGFDRSLVMGDSGSDNWETGKLYLDLTDKVYWYDNGQEAKMPKEFYSTEFYINKTLEYLQADAKSDKPFLRISHSRPTTFLFKRLNRSLTNTKVATTKVGMYCAMNDATKPLPLALCQPTPKWPIYLQPMWPGIL